MGRGGFPPSETGSFSAHHTAQWVGLFVFRCQVLGFRCQVSGKARPWEVRDTCEAFSSARLALALKLQSEHLNYRVS
jgi:hypothetical protein